MTRPDIDVTIVPFVGARAAESWIGASFRGMGGLYRSVDGGLHFERVLADDIWMVNCLHFRQGRLWMCANRAPGIDGVWYSDDLGTSFEKFLTFDQVSEPVACQADAQAICEAPWADFARELLSDAGTPAMAVDAGAGASATHADAGADDAGPRQGARMERQASGCRVGASGGVSGPAWLVFAAWLLARARRRRPA